MRRIELAGTEIRGAFVVSRAPSRSKALRGDSPIYWSCICNGCSAPFVSKSDILRIASDLPACPTCRRTEIRRRHAEAALRRRKAAVGTPEQSCKKCGCSKPLAAFSVSKDHILGVKKTCNDCVYVRRRPGQERRAPVTASKRESHRRWRFQARYKIDYDVAQSLKEKQGFRCAICRRPPKRELVLDHDHATGNARGWLCRSCNCKLAGVDEIGWLVNAFAYLARLPLAERAELATAPHGITEPEVSRG